MSRLKALIFDVDGTLADTERDGHRVAFNKAFKEASLDWHWSEELYGKLLAVTGGKERIRHFLDNYYQGSTSKSYSDENIAVLHALKTQHYTKMLAEGLIPLRTGVKRLLQEARQSNLTLAIATTTTPENVSALLNHSLGSNTEQWFAVIAAGDVVKHKKPSPEIYELALQQLGMDATQCLAFEDSEHGVASSTGAGLCTLVTVNGYTARQDMSGARLVIDSFGNKEESFNVLSGDANGFHYVNVPLLEYLHSTP